MNIAMRTMMQVILQRHALTLTVTMICGIRTDLIQLHIMLLLPKGMMKMMPKQVVKLVAMGVMVMLLLHESRDEGERRIQIQNYLFSFSSITLFMLYLLAHQNPL
jgi:hypothetical protein